ncbi:hypothetical protein [Deinococcus misasensis]|uniref:hypothetical protein n=1 Tax=Deinococcus misasensis TaxID=392413 RepID=UPI0005546B23|nr:hypothetical protein [Deinococcus misasensis]
MFVLHNKASSPWKAQWVQQYQSFQRRYPLETLHGVVLFSNLDEARSHTRITVHFSGFGESRSQGLWYFSPERLALSIDGKSLNWANPSGLTVVYDQSDDQKDLLTVLDKDGDTLLEVDFSVHIKNKIKLAGGFLLASGFRAHEITPASLASRDDVLEDYFKRARDPYSTYFLDGQWVATSVSPLPDVDRNS